MLNSTPIQGWPRISPSSQRCSLPRREYRRVRRVLQHMKCIQEQPHRMRRVGDPSVGESVPGKQITELVVTNRGGQRQHREHRQAQGDHCERHTDQQGTLPNRDSFTQSFDSAEPSLSQTWRKPRHYEKHWQCQPDQLRQEFPLTTTIDPDHQATTEHGTWSAAAIFMEVPAYVSKWHCRYRTAATRTTVAGRTNQLTMPCSSSKLGSRSIQIQANP
jgi:hypothetical protein